MSEILVSVIIPVYNVELFIRECLDSVLNQTQKNVEIIVVDDGSTDRTGDIVREYAAHNSTIKYVRQVNKGQSVARNVGLSIASGKYIVFVDGDDWITREDSLSKMVAAIQECNCDFVQCSIEFLMGYRSTKYMVAKIPYVEGKEILERTINVNNILTSPCAKIYSKKFLIENQLFFIEGLVNEDTAFSIMVASKALRVGFLDDIVYCVREREGSTSRASFKRMFKTMHEVLSYTRTFLQENKRYDDVKEIFEARYKRSMLYNLLQSAQRNNYRQFLSDWVFCLKNTDYMVESKYRYSRYLPFPHRMLYFFSKCPKVFFILFRMLNKLGLKMH